MSAYSEPSGDGIRVDAALYAGGKPSMHYAKPARFLTGRGVLRSSPVSQALYHRCQDPLVGKLICYAPGEGREGEDGRES